MNEFIEKSYPQLIDLIYSSALEPDLWKVAIRNLSDVFQDAPCSMYIDDRDGTATPYMIEHRLGAEAVADYQSHYSLLNPYPEMAIQLCPPGGVTTGLACISKSDSERTEFYNDWMRPNNWKPEHIGGVVFNEHNRIGIIALSPQSSNYEDLLPEDCRKLSLIVPHIARALEINKALAQKSPAPEALEAFAEHIATGAIVVDDHKRILYMNAAAQNIIDHRQALNINKSRQLYCYDRNGNNALQKALELSNNLTPSSSSHNFFRFSCVGTGSLFIGWVLCHSCSRFSETTSSEYLLSRLTTSTQRLVIIKEMTTTINIAPDHIQSFLGLTPAESRIVSALSKGWALFEYADAHDISRHTVRKQLSSIFDKLGVSSQQQLTSLVANLRDLTLPE